MLTLELGNRLRAGAGCCCDARPVAWCIAVLRQRQPIPETIAANLLPDVIVSANGLGRDMYQAARWAENWVAA